jgi:hypothetical protein
MNDEALNSDEEAIAGVLRFGAHLPEGPRARFEQQVRELVGHFTGFERIRELINLLAQYPMPPEERARREVDAFFRHLFRTRAEIEAENRHADEWAEHQVREHRFRMEAFGMPPEQIGEPPVRYVMEKTTLPPLALPAPIPPEPRQRC